MTKIYLSAQAVERAAKEREAARLRMAERRYHYPGRDHRARAHKRATREFIMWDGEGPKDAGYALFGNSKRMEICHPFLETEECLQLIYDAEIEYPDAIHFGFGFNYDVSMILRQLKKRELQRLRSTTYCVWGDWQFQYIPHKWFSVKRGKVQATIFDVHTFFPGNYQMALSSMGVGPWQQTSVSNAQNAHILQESGLTLAQRIMRLAQQNHNWQPNAQSTPGKSGNSGHSDMVTLAMSAMTVLTEPEIIEAFKILRGEFMWADMPLIREYMRLELKYGPPLMEAVRESVRAAGYEPHSWHGPGAIANMAINKDREGASVTKAMKLCPAPVRMAAKYAYFGGRFNQFLIGHMQQPIWEADIRSAYPYYATMLPNLTRGKWRRGKKYEPGKFAVYHIRYVSLMTCGDDRWKVHPLPKREGGGVVWPSKVEGWWWAPEAELVKDDPCATFCEAWVFDEEDSTDRPFAFLQGYYRRRKEAKDAGRAEAYALKIIINAIYGQLAKRAGWKKKGEAPKTHQLEWAGFITSGCRAAVHKVAVACGDKLVSINTDSVQALCPLPVDEGPNLGQWEVTQYDDGIMWQAGIYCLKKDGEWVKAKSRGIPKNSYSPDKLITAMNNGESLWLSKNMFIPFSIALQGRWDLCNKWITVEAEFTFGGKNFRTHVPRLCKDHCKGTIHRTLLAEGGWSPYADIWSKPHFLPWLDEPDPIETEKDDILIYDLRELDGEDEWMLRYEV